MPCKQCADLGETRNFESPAQLERALAVVRARVADGTLIEAVGGSALGLEQPPPFAELRAGPWPDAFAYTFRCTACGALYRFSAETYHGRGGQWQPVGSTT